MVIEDFPYCEEKFWFAIVCQQGKKNCIRTFRIKFLSVCESRDNFVCFNLNLHFHGMAPVSISFDVIKSDRRHNQMVWNFQRIHESKRKGMKINTKTINKIVQFFSFFQCNALVSDEKSQILNLMNFLFLFFLPTCCICQAPNKHKSGNNFFCKLVVVPFTCSKKF
jgi:hypothetical protein